MLSHLNRNGCANDGTAASAAPLPGQSGTDVRAMLTAALDDLADRVAIDAIQCPSTTSPLDTPLSETLVRVRRSASRHSAHPIDDCRSYRRSLLSPAGGHQLRLRAALWDFGGVQADSPFDAFARYECQHDLPAVKVDDPDIALAELEATIGSIQR